MSCPTMKKGYATKEYAEQALYVAISYKGKEKTPCRYYQCERCDRFHLTSKPERA